MIWFNLILLLNGSEFWLQSFETYEDCRAVELDLEERGTKANLVCRRANVEPA
jgi:hypothetical protein